MEVVQGPAARTAAPAPAVHTVEAARTAVEADRMAVAADRMAAVAVRTAEAEAPVAVAAPADDNPEVQQYQERML